MSEEYRFHRMRIEQTGTGATDCKVYLDGRELRGVTALQLNFDAADDSILATINIDLEGVDLDVLTLIHLIARTETPLRIEEAITALKRLKAGLPALTEPQS